MNAILIIPWMLIGYIMLMLSSTIFLDNYRKLFKLFGYVVLIGSIINWLDYLI